MIPLFCIYFIQTGKNKDKEPGLDALNAGVYRYYRKIVGVLLRVRAVTLLTIIAPRSVAFRMPYAATFGTIGSRGCRSETQSALGSFLRIRHSRNPVGAERHRPV